MQTEMADGKYGIDVWTLLNYTLIIKTTHTVKDLTNAAQPEFIC